MGCGCPDDLWAVLIQSAFIPNDRHVNIYVAEGLRFQIIDQDYVVPHACASRLQAVIIWPW